MWYIPMCIGAALAEVRAYQEESQRFVALCKSLPPEQAKQLRHTREKQRQEDLQHQKNLAVAREGRSLNFWGNR